MTSTKQASRWLPDVNVLVALAWDDHDHHERCHAWLNAHPGDLICTCPITEMGLVRISAMPRKTGGRMATSTDALRLLAVWSRLEQHLFLPDSLSWREVEALQGPLQGYRQVTDAYLLALARVNRARVVTLDHGLMALQGAKDAAELLA
jgi:uncharacterized protein